MNQFNGRNSTVSGALGSYNPISLPPGSRILTLWKTGWSYAIFLSEAK
jgi:hypothetical protein